MPHGLLHAFHTTEPTWYILRHTPTTHIPRRRFHPTYQTTCLWHTHSTPILRHMSVTHIRHHMFYTTWPTPSIPHHKAYTVHSSPHTYNTCPTPHISYHTSHTLYTTDPILHHLLPYTLYPCSGSHQFTSHTQPTPFYMACSVPRYSLPHIQHLDRICLPRQSILFSSSPLVARKQEPGTWRVP